jgi:hypothetical protein
MPIDPGPRKLTRVTMTSLLKSTSDSSSTFHESIIQNAHRARHMSNKVSGRPSSSERVSGSGESDSKNAMMRWTRAKGKVGWLDRMWPSRGAHNVTEEFGGEKESNGNSRFLLGVKLKSSHLGVSDYASTYFFESGTKAPFSNSPSQSLSSAHLSFGSSSSPPIISFTCPLSHSSSPTATFAATFASETHRSISF